MDYSKLEYFRIIAKYNNITKAAKELNVSQPNLSNALTLLENNLGFPLFKRRKGKISITKYGELLLESVEYAFQEINEGANKALNLYENNNNTISISSTMSYFIDSAISEYLKLNKIVRINYKLKNISYIYEQLIHNNIDFAVTGKYDFKVDFEWCPIFKTDIYLAYNIESNYTINNNFSIDKLKDENFLCYCSENEYLVQQVCKRAGFIPKIILNSNTSIVSINYLNENLGIMLMPSNSVFSFYKYFQKDNIRIVKLNKYDYNSYIGLLKLKNKKLTPESQLFYDFVKKHIVAKIAEAQDFANNLLPKD